MKNTWTFVYSVFFLLSFLEANALPASHENLNQIIKQVKNTIVNISVEKSNPDDMGLSIQSLGSGVIIDANEGIIVTCAHVVNHAQHLLVILNDKRRFIGSVIGTDEISDIALMKIQAENLQAIDIEDKNNLQLGEGVIAIGSPYGLSDSITFGIVSSLNRDLSMSPYDNYIQTDAQINFGNSGGALINKDGKLVGINASILASNDSGAGGNTGIGFAIPVETFEPITKQLLQYGDIKRGRLGLYIQPLNPQLSTAMRIKTDSGVLVSDVIDNGPAMLAGIQTGDIITHVNDKLVESNNHLNAIIGTLRSGENVQIKLLRQNKNLTKQVKTSDDFQTKKESKHLLRGVVFADYNVVDGQSLRTKGAVVLKIERGSPAWASGMQHGDVIIEVNGNVIENSQDLQAIDPNDTPLLLKIKRNSFNMFVSVN